MDIFNRIYGEAGPIRLPEYPVLLEQSMVDLQLKTQFHDSTWHISQASWSVDQDAGTIVFTLPDGTTATCAVQFVGSYYTKDGTWLWGWDHPSAQPALQEHARNVKAYGEQYGIERLTTQKLHCTEQDAWQFTALACRINEAQGGYRGPAGPTLVFMTFGEVNLCGPE